MIGIGIDRVTGWWQKFHKISMQLDISCKLIDLYKSNWIKEVSDCEAILFRFNYMEPHWSLAMEKLYFMEFIMGKKVFPSLNLRWHYNNKRAQSYMNEFLKIESPSTFVSYSYDETLSYLKKCSYPQVSKSAGGASSQNVRLLKNYGIAYKELKKVFNKGLLNNIANKLLWRLRLRPYGQKNYILYQELIKNNHRDYRITTIGPDIAFAFYRQNRPGDFRASGSGIIDYHAEHDFNAINYCLDLSNKMKFDTMCYDIVYDKGKLKLLEYSYTYVDEAIFRAPGHFVRRNSDILDFVEGNVWPEELIFRHLLDKWKINARGRH